MGPILGSIAINDQHRSWFQGVLVHSASEQDVRRAGLDRPFHPLDFDVNPGVGIDPLHFRHCGIDEFDGTFCVEFGAKRVMRKNRGRHRSDEQTNTDDCKSVFSAHRLFHVSLTTLWRASYARMPVTTRPSTSVSRKSRPMCLYVSRV